MSLFISKQDYREHNDDATVHFEVTLTEENMNIAIQEGLEKKFKLTTTIATTNMHLIDSKGVIKKYDTPEQSMIGILFSAPCKFLLFIYIFLFCSSLNVVLCAFQFLKSSSTRGLTFMQSGRLILPA